MSSDEVEQEEHPLKGLSFNLPRDISIYYQEITT